ncbi:leucine rich adaptor protein 1-like [Amia ocellicauda]|uniref:leucine rich adaptor protein 1-like n=1 Tax=Amia ocellicauda TaxID=2972642 RepID=UPI0034641E01|nr:LUR1L protein [Amia calva]
MEDVVLPDFKDIESKMGRKVPESLIRSLEEGLHQTKDDKPALPNAVSLSDCALKRLESKMLFLKQEMAHLRAIDVKLMQQLLSINDGIESIKWVIDEKGTMASREGSLAGSLYSLSESQDTSLRGSCDSLHDGCDGLDGISVGSYLDTLAEDDPGHTSPTDLEHFPDGPIIEDGLDKAPLHKDIKRDSDEYYCFG